MTTNPEEFVKFHKVLMLDAPEGFVPHYFALPPGKKANPPIGWTMPPYPGRLTFEEALAEMKRGSNIAVSGTTTDRLGILDVDWAGVGKAIVEPMVRTLKIVSRKRRGFHHYYWWTDTRMKDNIPAPRETPYGEFRCDFLYVLCPGSFVESDPSLEWFGTEAQLNAMSEEEKNKIRGGNPKFKFYVLPASEVGLVGQYTMPEQRKVANLDVERLPDFFRKLYEENHPVKTAAEAEAPKKKKGLWHNDTSGFWPLTFEQLLKGKYDPEILRGHADKDRFPSPLHDSATGKDTSWSEVESKDGEKFVQMRCWGCGVSHSPLSALAVLTGLGKCQEMGKTKGKPSKLDLRDKVTIDKMLEYAKKNGILSENEPVPYKVKKEKKAEVKCVGFAAIGSVVYRQCREPFRFARFDKATKTLTYVDKITETDEYPYTLAGITHPKELKSYGSALDLYRKTKAWWKKVYAGGDEDHTALALYAMYHGTLEPFKHKSPQIHPRGRTGTGKGAIEEGFFVIGDRARKTTDLKLPTGYRVNDKLRGGLEILDEQEDRKDVENYARAKYDPRTWQHRIVKPGEPNAPDAISAFASPGPCIVSSRMPFSDNATPDRGIVIHTTKQEEFALEMTEEVVAEGDELLCELGMFWSEHYGEISPSTKEELAYNRTTEEGREPRLVLAYRTFLKLAKIIGGEAEQDLKSFLVIQTAAMRLAKSESLDGQLVNAFYHLIRSGSIVRTKRDGTTWNGTIGFQLHPPIQNPIRSFAVIVTGGSEDPREPPDVQGIGFDLIGKVTGVAFGDISKRLLEYGILRKRITEEYGSRQIRTLVFDTEILDSALAEFDPDYNDGWKKEVGVQRQL